MSISNGQDANATNFNNAFLSRTSDSDTTGKIDLNNTDSAAITDVQSTINGALSDINTLQGDVVSLDGRLDVLEGQESVATHAADTTSVHGIADTSLLVTTTGTQTLTNKDIDGGTASNTSRLTLPKNTKTNLDGLTRKEGTIVYATDSKKPFFDDGTSLIEVGSGSGGGGINYITNPDAETDTTGWFVSKNTTASSIPDLGFVSSGTNITWTRSTFSPLRSLASFVLTKDAANRRGEQAYTNFTIDAADKAKPLQISFDVETSSNYVDNDLIVYILDVDNSKFIEPVNFQIKKSGITQTHIATFQTSVDADEYTLFFHVAGTNDLAWTAKIDNVSVGPQQTTFLQSGIVGEIIATSSTTPPSGFLYCNGQAVSRTTYADLFASIGLTYGSGDGSTTFNVPDLRGRFLRGVDGGVGRDPDRASRTAMNTGGNTGDNVGSVQGHAFQTHTHTQNAHSHSLFGRGGSNLNNTADRFAASTANEGGSDRTFVSITAANQTATNQNAAALGTHAQASPNETRPLNANVAYHICWRSGTTALSTDSGRVIAARVDSSGTQSITSASWTKVTSLATASIDTNGHWDSTNDRIKIIVPGLYRISASASFSNNGTGARAVSVTYNGGSIPSESGAGFPGSSSDILAATGSWLRNLNSGDYVELAVYQSSGGALNLNSAWISIEKIQSGSQAITAAETVACRYTTNAGNPVASGTITYVDFEDKAFDTHNMVLGAGGGNKTTTNTGWRAVIPTAGKYQISANVASALGGGWAVNEEWSIFVLVNGVNVISPLNFNYSTHTSYLSCSLSGLLDLLTGDIVEIALYQSSGASLNILATGASNYISIHRVG